MIEHYYAFNLILDLKRFYRFIYTDMKLFNDYNFYRLTRCNYQAISSMEAMAPTHENATTQRVVY
jgi:hypothetical protein